MITKFEFQVEETFHKKRLDEFLFAVFSSLSKMYLRDVLKSENCQINGYTANGGNVLKTNDFIEIEVDLERETAMKPQEIPLEIVYEDQHIMIVNKPAGLLVHPTHREKNGTLLNGLAFYLNNLRQGDKEKRRQGEEETRRQGDKETRKINFDQQEIPNPKSEIPNQNDPKSEIPNQNDPKLYRPGLVHRLDKQTSGLILVTKNQRALSIMSKHFKRKLVEKKYLAWVEGVVKEDSGEINAPIGRFAEEKYWNVKSDGKTGITKFWVKKRFSDKTLLELEPVTGRTNQLRIHCAYLGHPIIGDVRYNGREFSRLCLHAARLKFHHPNSNEPVEFEIELPEEMKLRENGK